MNLLELLPHRPPFLFLDRVLMVEPGAWAAALTEITRADPSCDAQGRWPSVLLVEMMAQAAGLAAAEGGGAALIAKINRVRCRGPVAAGARLLVVARLVRRFGSSAMVRAAVRHGRRHLAACEIVLRFL